MADYLRSGTVTAPLGIGEARKRARALELCGGWLEFRDYFELGEVRLTSGHFCQQPKLCTVCALRRAGRSIRRAVERMSTVLADRPKLRPFLVTLTVRNGPDLAERHAHLLRALRALNQRRRDAERGENVGTLMSKVEGGIWSIEFKRGDGSNLWHPHSHAVWLSEREPSALELSAEWRQITGDSFIVHVAPFRNLDDPGPDLCEVFKYALKLGDLSLPDNLEAFCQLRGRHLIGSFGCLRGVKLDESCEDEALEADLGYFELLYRHVQADGYRLVRSRLKPPI